MTEQVERSPPEVEELLPAQELLVQQNPHKTGRTPLEEVMREPNLFQVSNSKRNANKAVFLPMSLGNKAMKTEWSGPFEHKNASIESVLKTDSKRSKEFFRILIIEGSLEVKLPTIWTDEKQSRAEAERRERLEERRVEEKESEERRCRCAKR